MKHTIKWVHPSCVDALIEFLENHPSRRKEFLRRGGYGTILAVLSIYAGYEPVKWFPLLIDSDDWQICAQRITQLSSTMRLDETVVLLQRLAELLESYGSHRSERKQLLKQFGSQCLACIREQLDRSPNVLSEAIIKFYYEVSVRCGVLMPMPSLIPTLEQLTEQATRMYFSRTSGTWVLDSEVLDALAVWLRTLFLVQLSEPRLLLIADVPTTVKKLEAHMTQHLAELVGALDPTVAGLSLEDLRSLDNSIAALRALVVAADSFHFAEAVFRELEASRRTLALVVRKRIALLEEPLEDFEEDYDHRRPPWRQSSSRTSISSTTSQGLSRTSIEAVFSDL